MMHFVQRRRTGYVHVHVQRASQSSCPITVWKEGTLKYIICTQYLPSLVRLVTFRYPCVVEGTYIIRMYHWFFLFCFFFKNLTAENFHLDDLEKANIFAVQVDSTIAVPDLR